jgi:CHAT domain-containing protein/tetratricopeptide (TPR) repeat protein
VRIPPSRSRRRPVVAAIALGVWAAGTAVHVAGPQAVAGASSEPLPALRQGSELAGDLAAGQTDRRSLSLSAGDFAAIVVEQRGVDLTLTLTTPSGEALVVVDGMDDEYRPERLVAVAPASGAYRLDISSATPNGRGAYRLRVVALRPATAADTTLVDGERAFTVARRLRNPGKGATWPEALNGFETALARFTDAGDAIGVMKTTLELGITENYLSKPDALERGRTAVRLARETGDQGALARALRLVGNILVGRGDYPGGSEALDEAWAVAAALGARNSEARGLNDAAIAYRRRGDVEHAVDLYERALMLARATADGQMEGLILNNLGVAYKTLGELDRALELYEQALAHRRAAGDSRSQYHALINLAIVRRGRGEFEAARLHAEEALAISRRIGDGVREAGALNALGQALSASGRHAEALERLGHALTLSRSLPNRDEEAIALTAMGRALRELGRFDEAATVLNEALAESRRVQFPVAERDDLTELAILERRRGDLAAAARHLEAAMTIDEAMRSNITSPELRASFVAAELDRYELFLELLHEQHVASPGAGFDARALRVSERARARVLLDGVLDGGVDVREGVPPALLAEEQRLQKALNTASSRLSAALAEGEAATVVARQREVERLSADYAGLQTDIRRQSPGYADLVRPQPLAADRIQQEVLDDETVLLEFALGDTHSWLWAVTRDSLTLHALAGRAEIERRARRWYERLVARQPRDGEEEAAYTRRVAAADRQRDRDGQAVSDALLGPIAAELGGAWRGRRLAVVTAGVLDILPMNALPEPRPPGADATAAAPARGALLAAHHEIVRLPSASVIAALRRDRRVDPPSKMLAVLADPVFERADPRVARLERAPATTWTTAPALLSRNALGRARVPRLPFSRDEAEAIAALAPVAGVLKATGFDATRDAALGRALRDYRIVHFATHGVFDSARPALSGLILSLVDRRGGYRNGYVRLHDIYNLRLNAELVVLSACDTALGTDIKGEGLVGLARAFMYAGAPRVVASLWAVNDLATSELMTRFYRGMLQRSLRPAAALHAAQREMQATMQWRDPYYWAGFTLVGDWR